MSFTCISCYCDGAFNHVKPFVETREFNQDFYLVKAGDCNDSRKKKEKEEDIYLAITTTATTTLLEAFGLGTRLSVRSNWLSVDI